MWTTDREELDNSVPIQRSLVLRQPLYLQNKHDALTTAIDKEHGKTAILSFGKDKWRVTSLVPKTERE
jgi:hypothetical protein